MDQVARAELGEVLEKIKKLKSTNSQLVQKILSLENARSPGKSKNYFVPTNKCNLRNYIICIAHVISSFIYAEFNEIFYHSYEVRVQVSMVTKD